MRIRILLLKNFLILLLLALIYSCIYFGIRDRFDIVACGLIGVNTAIVFLMAVSKQPIVGKIRRTNVISVQAPAGKTDIREKKARIAYLLARYVDKTITSEENDELDEWVGSSDKNMILFEEFTDPDKVKAALKILNKKQDE
jgi:hypothetical protein